jgi:hypothetical protein
MSGRGPSKQVPPCIVVGGQWGGGCCGGPLGGWPAEVCWLTTC